ncbi:ribonuclease Z [Neolewinella antarctica]|uniref:Ribonuclease Z n=1 Tax=Neolewinella antarctica TaxID=442734 RepID=A0ABX0X815_9BACT|nr:ribonuclease Z [Neolewinella antarctica]NJC25346.1 ribonuclease Z [Neolewinella antarctica]
MKFEVTILGTAGAVPSHGRFCSGVVLRTETTDILIDCGEGTQMQLQNAGIGMGKCKLILITHLHGDHYFGLPGLLSSLALSGRTEPLLIISPLHLRPRINALFELDRYPMPYAVTFQTYLATEFAPVVTIDDLEVFAFPLQHRTPTNGYLVREAVRQPNIIKDRVARYAIPWQDIAAIKAGADYTTPAGELIQNDELIVAPAPPRSFAYCSDTIYFPELADYVKGVDLLYHEATFLADMEADARKKGHATAAQAATIARDAGAGQLVMGHFSSRYSDVSAHQEEARAIFPNSFAARDLNQFGVSFVGRGI